MIAVLDACCLYPPALRDMLMWLASVAAYEPRWTEEIHAEWMRNVLADRPDVTREQLERTRRLMDQVHSGSLVTGYEAHIPILTLPDENDRHVLAAAIQAGASAIVTFNTRHFPVRSLAQHSIHALHPDAFLEKVFTANAPRFLLGIQKHRASLLKPSKTEDEYLVTLRAQGLHRTARRLETHRNEI